MITDEELFQKLGKIELRNGIERDVRSYVLRGRSYTDSERRIITDYMREYGFFYEDGILDYKKLFGSDKPVVIEIGFGMGDTTYDVAIRRPEYNYIGIEVFMQGFIKLLKLLGDNNIDNVRIIRFNAVDVITHMIAENSTAGFHVFFPDPWP